MDVGCSIWIDGRKGWQQGWWIWINMGNFVKYGVATKGGCRFKNGKGVIPFNKYDLDAI